MSEQTSESLRAWFKRVEPLYPELFNTAHAICGNYDLAEDALRGAILEVWAQNAEAGMGFRERLRATLREEAFDQIKSARSEPDFTWQGFAEDEDEPLLRQACRESAENQRLLMLKYGVGLSAGRISAVTGSSVAEVRGVVNRFESRCRRKLPARDRGHFDALFTELARRQLTSRAGVPHPAAVYRAFEAEASQLEVPEHRLSRVVYRLLVFLMALFCAVIFWLFAVLVQSPAIEPLPDATDAPPGITVETVQQTEAPG